ncbi:Na+/H+ antiporter subunit E [Tsukamurella sp. 8F]|uniref:Na+/H+ antiporter subunit E n=1 Tax=unclassified Tsukamurella TaxID=2633480 RepID=UPI0023B9557C|nr:MULTISPECIES: Na+/H+ antiporter subunit E [unclassified Tsukamurella]MDF0529474.1 Na+/H+ antiporter subunit E [Tsukamurella sp. 8J]MDF0585838.1 Na+/H+ antiporter subunit E [Tsukamurella sp. 8F]
MARRIVERVFPDWRDGRAIALKLAQVVWLTVVWMMLWGTLSVANAVAGAGVALLILAVLPLPPVPVEGRLHVLSLLRLLAVFTVLMLRSSLQVAWFAIRPSPPPLSAVLRAKVTVKSDLVLTLLVDAMNLVPGTVVLDVDAERRLLYVHVIDVGTEKGVRGFYRDTALMEKLFVAAFERDTEWHPSPMHGIDDEYHHVTAEQRTHVGEPRHVAEPEHHSRGKEKP